VVVVLRWNPPVVPPRRRLVADLGVPRSSVAVLPRRVADVR